MRKLLKISLCLLLVMVAVSANAAKKKGGYQKAYVFGFASSFVDSVAYLTDVQELDSAYILPNGFISDRQLYSLQLYGHVNEKRGVENPTAAFFFALSPKKIAKKYQKVKSLYIDNPNLTLVILPKDEFRFHAEEYMEVLVTETAETPEPEGKKSKKK